MDEMEPGWRDDNREKPPLDNVAPLRCVCIKEARPPKQEEREKDLCGSKFVWRTWFNFGATRPPFSSSPRGYQANSLSQYLPNFHQTINIYHLGWPGWGRILLRPRRAQAQNVGEIGAKNKGRAPEIVWSTLRLSERLFLDALLKRKATLH